MALYILSAYLKDIMQANINLPPRALNGGLYTGEPFAEGAPYANIPVFPDTGFMIHYNLLHADPPPAAKYHYPGGGNRPGNNIAITPGIVPLTNDKQYGILCSTADCSNKLTENCKCSKCRFRKYAYL